MVFAEGGAFKNVPVPEIPFSPVRVFCQAAAKSTRCGQSYPGNVSLCTESMGRVSIRDADRTAGLQERRRDHGQGRRPWNNGLHRVVSRWVRVDMVFWQLTSTVNTDVAATRDALHLHLEVVDVLIS